MRVCMYVCVYFFFFIIINELTCDTNPPSIVVVGVVGVVGVAGVAGVVGVAGVAGVAATAVATAFRPRTSVAAAVVL